MTSRGSFHPRLFYDSMKQRKKGSWRKLKETEVMRKKKIIRPIERTESGQNQNKIGYKETEGEERKPDWEYLMRFFKSRSHRVVKLQLRQRNCAGLHLQMQSSVM